MKQMMVLPDRYRPIFEKLKGQIEVSLASGLKSRQLEFIDDFAYTYLQALSAFSHIKSHPDWQKSLQPCQKLLVQANILLYPEKNVTLKRLWEGVWIHLPAQLWANRYFHLGSAFIFFFCALIGFLIVRENFETASMFISGDLRSSHELEAYLFSQDAQKKMLTHGRDWGVEMKSLFAYTLMLNNIKVAIQCFVSGFLFGIPTFLMLMYNGLMLGALPALFYDGDIVGLWAWLLPHGVPELSAIILAGGAGLKIGLTMLNPGARHFGTALKNTLKSLASTVFICIVLLVWAAVVESFVRQSDLSNAQRLTIAGGSVIPLFLLFARAYFAHQTLKSQ